ncbi:hypothetical protein FBU30_002741 [Linnemannia zychae]|nr:hypothetical protein FBU30_002741 [Linnemannia zychae]
MKGGDKAPTGDVDGNVDMDEEGTDISGLWHARVASVDNEHRSEDGELDRERGKAIEGGEDAAETEEEGLVEVEVEVGSPNTTFDWEGTTGKSPAYVRNR